ncbi:hypothetical protein KP509_36G054700 [Ceratopteris richardii]|nr:hypothetical protein KP509_36G054700 [Ceratopteris richardii]
MDEPLEVQLRFDLGNIAETQVLINTDGQRESHWNFVRQEQDRFQTSCEEGTPLPSNAKPLEMKPDDDCERWSRPSSHADTQLFVDAQDGVRTVADEFGRKDQFTAEMVQHDTHLHPQSTYVQCEKQDTFTGEVSLAPEESTHNSCGGTVLIAAVKDSHFSLETPDAITCDKSCGDKLEKCEENHELGLSAANLVEDPLLYENDSSDTEVKTAKKPEFTIRPVPCEEANKYQNFSGSSNRQVVESFLPQFPRIDNPEFSTPNELISPTDEVGQQANTTQELPASAEEKVRNEHQEVNVTPGIPSSIDGTILSDSDLKPESEENIDNRKFSKMSDTVQVKYDSRMVLIPESNKVTTKSVNQGSDAGDTSSSPEAHGHDNDSSAFNIDFTKSDSKSESNQETLTNEDLEGNNMEDRKISMAEASLLSKVEKTCKELEEYDKVGGTSALELDTTPKISSVEAVGTVHSFAVTISTMPVHMHGVCSMSANDMHNKQGGSDESGADVLSDSNPPNTLWVAENTNAISNIESLSTQEICDGDTTSQYPVTRLFQSAINADGKDTAVKQHVPGTPELSTCAVKDSNSHPCSFAESSYRFDNSSVKDTVSPVDKVPQLSNSSPLKDMTISQGHVEETFQLPNDNQLKDTTVAQPQVPEHPPIDDAPIDQSSAAETLQAPNGNLEPVIGNMVSHGYAFEGNHTLEQLHDPDRADVSMLTTTDTSANRTFETQLEAKGANDCFSQEQPVENTDDCMQQGENAVNFSLPPAKYNPLSENMVSMEATHHDGTLHVLLDLQKEVITDDVLPKNVVGNDLVRNIAAGLSVDDEGSGKCNDSGQVFPEFNANVTEDSSLKDATRHQEKFDKEKVVSLIDNNRMKDTARGSPLQGQSDHEQRNNAAESLGKRKIIHRAASQRKGSEPLEDLTTPKKPGSKGTLGRKRSMQLPILQDAVLSPAVKEGSQTSAGISKAVLSGNPRNHTFPDMNGLEVPILPTISASQPFSESQQVQLRAQILVYGSLIQGAAPEEALMVAAFSNVTGGTREGEISGRAAWEKQWQIAADRFHAKNLRNVPREDPSRANAALMPKSSIACRVLEGSVKPIMSSIMASSTIDSRNTALVPPRASDMSNFKAQASRLRQPSDFALDNPLNKGNSVQAGAVTSGPITFTTPRMMCPSFSENPGQLPNPCTDPHQSVSHSYFQSPPLGPFLTGTPQWFPNPSFGSWVPHIQPSVYTPAIFSHAQPVVSSDQLLETRTTSPATVIPVSSSVDPTTSHPVVVGVSVVPTAAANQIQNKQPVPESRPRKRKKTHMEGHMSSVDRDLACATCAPSDNVQLPKFTQEMSIVALQAADTPSPNLISLPASGCKSVEDQVKSSLDTQDPAKHISDANASAEQAAALAASALTESESLWSQMKAKQGTGLAPDVESQLVSSAMTMAAAASVAKAAAAAAKAAYDAAIQAKRFSEGVLDKDKESDALALDACRVLDDKAEHGSKSWSMPESSRSILASARIASKQRLEVIAAAKLRAENFDSIVRAAGLATKAIAQVGSIIAMGESVPFTLEMLLEAGPEGINTLEDKINDSVKSTDLQSLCGKGTPKSKEKNKELPLRIASDQEALVQEDTEVDNGACGNTMAGWQDNCTGTNLESGVGLMTDLNKQKPCEHLTVSIPICGSGSRESRSMCELVENQVFIPDNRILKGSFVEVISDQKGISGVWFSARVQNVDSERAFVIYDDLLADDGYSHLEEWIQMKGIPGQAPRIRLAHPNMIITPFESTKKRRREAVEGHKWSLGDRVDAWMRNGWWEGEIKEIVEDGESIAKVLLPGDGNMLTVNTSKLRPSLIWSAGEWVLWTDAKERREFLGARINLPEYEGDTPLAKRHRKETDQAKSPVKQKLAPSEIADISATQREIDLVENSMNLLSDSKSFADDGTKSRQQGPRVAIGVPRPAKKRKLVEVGKHLGSSRAQDTSVTAIEVNNEKSEDPLAQTPGSFGIRKADGLKVKRQNVQHPVLRAHKDPDSETVHMRNSGSRFKKDKSVFASRAPGQKNVPTREGLRIVSESRESKLIRKDKILPDRNQPRSQEQSEDRHILSSAALAESQTFSVTAEKANKISSLGSQRREKPSIASKVNRRELSQPVEETDGSHVTAVSHKEKVKHSCSSQSKGLENSTPASGNKSKFHSKRKETQYSKHNEETGNSVKETSNFHAKVAEPLAAHATMDQQETSTKPSDLQLNHQRQEVSARNIEKNKDTGTGKDAGKLGPEAWEPRRTSRKIQPTSKLLEGLQTAPKLGKNSSSHDRVSRAVSKAAQS